MPSKRTKNTTSPACPPGYVDFEVVQGVEGPCLLITHDASEGGHRLAGPKPWAGGKVSARFRVNIEEITRELAARQQGGAK